MSKLGDLVVVVGANIDGFKSAMRDAVSEVDYFADEIEKKFSAIEQVGQRMAQVGAGLSAAITVPLVALGTAAITTAAQFETTQIAFTTLSGSAVAAGEQLNALYKFAAETPFQVQGVLQATRTLLAMQFAAKDVLPVLRVLGDAASGLGLGQEGLERLVFHFGQIKALGTIDGRIIREMGQAGINAGQMLADALGKTVPEVMDMVHKKAIGATTAINALLLGMQDKFGGLMKNQSESLAGLWSNLKDNVTLALVDIGNTLLPVGKQIVQFLMDMTQHAKDAAKWFADLPAPVQTFALALAGVAAAAGPVLLFLGGAAIALPPLIALIGATSLALGTSTIALAGATAGLSLLIPALVAFGVWISDHLEGVKAFGKALLDVGLNVTGIASAVMAYTKANDAAKQARVATEAVADAMKTLRVNATDAFTALSDPKAAWAENHKRAVQEATAALHVLEDANKRGTVTTDQLAKAQQRLASIMAQKAPDFTERGEKAGGSKLSDAEKSQAKELDMELAHAKAMNAIEEDRVKFLQTTGQISDRDALERLNELESHSLAMEQQTLERKKAIYRANLTEKAAIDGQMLKLADDSALHLQQATEKMQVHEAKTFDTWLTGVTKGFQTLTHNISEAEGDILKDSLALAKVSEQLAKINEQRKEEAAQNALAMQRLQLERDYALQIGKTANSEIAYAKQTLELDKQEWEAKIKLLEAERNLETDTKKRAELDARVAAARNQANEREYAAMTRINQLQQQNTMLGKIQIGLWNTFNNAFKRLGQGISDAIVGAKSWGAAMKGVLQDVGKEILDVFIGAVLSKLAEALAGIVLKWLGLAAVTSTTNESAVGSEAAVGGAAAFASTAAIPIIGPELAPAAGAAAYAAILGTYGPLAAFETGTAFVPSTGIAMIHEGERIIDAGSNKTIAAALSRGLGNGGGTTVVNHFHGVTTGRDIARTVMQTIKTAGGPRFSPASS